MIIQNSMVPQLRVNVFGSHRESVVPPAARLWVCNDWLAACMARLGQLRPDQDARAIASMARELWLDVAGFDPVIAAEMEYETWLAGENADEPAATSPSP